ncbi:hypothetical protein [uncultured Roseobacter sp.]|uniref:hypothetical protein n=1 Tax=uncultured Roseobacter sp. TaxID=114847 RepID=UPI00261EC239|nr:hypothetical protein [uncultured Roseobacter sp.]
MTRAWSVDFANLILLLYTSALFAMLYPKSVWIAASLGLVTTAAFVYLFSIKPTRESNSFDLHHPDLRLTRLEFRTHPSFSFFAAKSKRRNLIMVPEWRADFEISENEPMIFHEFAHLKRGDTFAFVWLYPFVAVFSVCFILLATGLLGEAPSLHLVQFIGSLSGDPDGSMEEIVVAVILLPTFALIQMLLLMRDREYGADRYAFRLLGERYSGFIANAAKSEETDYQDRSLKDHWRTLVDSILHPTFGQRREALKNPFSYTELLGVWSGLHFSAILTFSIIVCAILTLEVIVRSHGGLGIDFFDLATQQQMSVFILTLTAGPLFVAILSHGSLVVRNTVVELGPKRSCLRLLPHLLATSFSFFFIALLINFASDGNVRAEEGWNFDFRRTATATAIFFFLLWAFWSRFAKPVEKNRLAFLFHGALAVVAAVLANVITLVTVPSIQ